MTKPNMPKLLSHSRDGQGITFEILRGVQDCRRLREMKAWLTKNKPNAEVREFRVDTEPGSTKWLEATKRFGKTSLPQVVLVHRTLRMHFGEVTDLEVFFPSLNSIKEVCEN